MIIASFNVENLFARAKALNPATWSEGEPALKAYERFNVLASKAVYSPADKQRMLEALLTLKVLVRTPGGNLRLETRSDRPLAVLRENRGDFLSQPRSGSVEIVATGRPDWVGWVELTVEPVDEIAVRSTARVINDIGADVLGVVEAEDRPALVRFNEQLLGNRYGHIMLVDGNDTRGIDVGLMTAPDIEIASVRSHVDDPDPAGDRPLFSRDAPVFHLVTPSGDDLWVAVSHLKSQSFTGGVNPDPLRTRQSGRLADIYRDLRAEGATNVVVMGDFNKGPTTDDPPRHPTLEALFADDIDLIDAASLQAFDPGPRPGTFQGCSVRQRLDYILLSPELAVRVTDGGVFRDGLWGNPKNKNPPTAWAVYPEITRSVHAASDHGLIWVDVAL